VVPGDATIGHMLLAQLVCPGTLGEYALLPTAAVTAKPAGLDFTTAAVSPLAGMAALAVDAIGAKPGQVVLVAGASGGADSYAVQLLAARGAAVVATGAADDAARLTGLGAAAVVDYTAGTWPASRARACWPSPVTDGRVTWLRVATSGAGTALAASASHRRWLACSPAERRAFQLP
jgi:NADPH:quinone reductase-like Zn-dependent oxidoreductase